MRDVLIISLSLTMLMIKSEGAYTMNLEIEEYSPSCSSYGIHSKKARHQHNTNRLKFPENPFLEEYNELLALRNQKSADVEKDVLFLQKFVAWKAQEIEVSFQELCIVQKSLQRTKRVLQEGENSKVHTPPINKQRERSETGRLQELRQRYTNLFLESLSLTFELQKVLKLGEKQKEIKLLDDQLTILFYKIDLVQDLKIKTKKIKKTSKIY